MDIQTSKIELVKLILNIESSEFIQKVSAFIQNGKSDFWNDLSLNEQKEIQKGIDDLERGDRILFTDFLNKIE